MSDKVREIFEEHVFLNFVSTGHGLRRKDNGEYVSHMLEDHWNTFQEGFEFGVKKALYEMAVQMDKFGDEQSNNPAWYKAEEKTKQLYGVE